MKKNEKMLIKEVGRWEVGGFGEGVVTPLLHPNPKLVWGLGLLPLPSPLPAGV